jgi:hypothetical protein
MTVKQKIIKEINTLPEDILPEVYRYLNTLKTKKTKAKGIDLNTFSFFQSMEATKGIKGSISDAVIEERRSE